MFKNKSNLIEIVNSVLPEERQVSWQETELAAWVFFGLNTFVGVQEGSGKTEANAFYPTDIDIGEWVETFKNAGMKGVILTAKHHDGFCMWQSDTTPYCLKNSPYLNSKGDIVKELSDECKKAGLKFGFSFSLCDRNTEKTGKAYDDLVCSQLTELLTKYGEIYEVKFDLNGEKKHEYDLKRYCELIRSLQPSAAIVNGPDVRHIGNSKAVCRPEEWNVVKPVSRLQKITKADKSKPDTFRTQDGKGRMELDLGSLKALKKSNSFCWQPAVADISLRDSWFYVKSEDEISMFLHRLKDIYFSTVGGNVVLELGVPIDQRGRIHESEKATLAGFGADMELLKSKPLIKKSALTSNCGEDSVENLKSDDETYFFSGKTDKKIEITADFGKEKIIRMIELGENMPTGQQIERFSVYTLKNGKFKKAETYSTVGYKKLILPKKPTVTSVVKIVIEKTRDFAALKTFEIYSA